MKNLFTLLLISFCTLAHSQLNWNDPIYNFQTSNGNFSIDILNNSDWVNFKSTNLTNKGFKFEGMIKGESLLAEGDIHLLGLGEIVSTSSNGNTIIENRRFNYSIGIDFMENSALDENGTIRKIEIIKNNGETFLRYMLPDGKETFMIGHHPGLNNLNFLHLKEPNSRIIISAAAWYKLDLGHKFVVHNGNSLFEGNIETTGAVGIGTSNFTDTDYKLFVKDGIRTEKVKVDIASANGWADYVFEKEYQLDSLEEVEDYIQKNGHLKDIPSAVNVVENGIELAEMNKLLLQKIEELTLYMIKQNKDIKLLKEQINK